MKRILTKSSTALLVMFMTFLILSSSVFALSPGQRRLLAKRAALVDAYRNLAEEVKGLQITGNTYVRDFVAESDEIATHFDTFIKGVKVVGRPIYNADGTCEVTVQVTIQQVVQELQRLQRTYHYVRSDVTYNFDTLITTVKKKVIRATGSGVAPER